MKSYHLQLACIAGLAAGGIQSLEAISLGDALDNTNLVWTTGGNAVWVGTNNVTFDGVDSGASGKITHNQVSWLQTTVNGPGQLSFWWKVESDPPDGLEFRLDDVLQDGKSGQSDWTYKTITVPAGAHTLKWQYVKDDAFNFGSDKGWVDRVMYVTGPRPSLGQALNTCGVAWTSGGNTNPTSWFAQTNMTHDGVMAAASDDIYNMQTNWIEATVTGVTNVSFWWKVSSEAGYDVLEFYRDSTLLASYSGDPQPWQQQSLSIPAGTHTLRWSYRKDGTGRVGEDKGWLDQVVFSPFLGSYAYTLTNTMRLSDGRFQMSIVGEAGCPCRLQFSTNLTGTNWNTLTNLTPTDLSTQFVDSGASNTSLRFYRTVSP